MSRLSSECLHCYWIIVIWWRKKDSLVFWTEFISSFAIFEFLIRSNSINPMNVLIFVVGLPLMHNLNIYSWHAFKLKHDKNLSSICYWCCDWRIFASQQPEISISIHNLHSCEFNYNSNRMRQSCMCLCVLIFAKSLIIHRYISWLLNTILEIISLSHSLTHTPTVCVDCR